jgi:hypothetical protein
MNEKDLAVYARMTRGPTIHYRVLTGEELRALTSWAEQHGRYWKEPLRDLWNRAVVSLGMPNSDRDTTVYALRNSHGPSWLRRFRLPKEGPQ